LYLPHRFPAADLFEGAHVDSSLVSAERLEHSDHKKPIREKWAGILNL
jgi:hypothetical protein